MSPQGRSWRELIGLWLLLVVTALLTRPLFPVDETRYASVAWEMWSRGDFLVPYLNGEPYSHKPPLYFWLVHAGWWLFGVHEWVLRLVAPLLALGVLFASGRLARQLWPDDETTARLVPWLVMGSLFFMAFMTWVQIDLLLVLMTLLAVSGFLHAARGAAAGWLLAGIGIGLGVLAKGPVILLHVLPVALLAPLWRRDRRGGWRWYTGIVVSVVIGALIALAWALPAAQAGGEVYREAILWGQTAERMVASFAHAHPVWWYLPWLPLLFAPWILLPWGWSALRCTGIRQDPGLRFCLTWLLAVFILMSLVSGKQLKYLLPLVPAFSLLFARVLARMEPQPVSPRPWLAAAAIMLFGLVLTGVPVLRASAAWMADINPLWGGLLLVAGLLLWWQRSLPPTAWPRRLTLYSAFIVLVVHLGVFRVAAPAYDVRPAARVIAGLQADGHRVASVARYHGQFGFAGRLTMPLVQLQPGQAPDWAARHGEDYLVVIGRQRPGDDPRPVYSQPYRSGYLAIWTGEAITNHPAVLQ